jgi:ribosomal-protein-alanine N-acetyltransferase
MAVAAQSTHCPFGALEVGGHAYLRRPTAADENAFVAGMATSRPLHRPWVQPMDEAGFRQYLARAELLDVDALVVCRRDDRRIAGFVTLSQIFYGGLRGATCGYAAFASSAGQGYMAEGLSLTLRHAFTSLRLHRVEANIQPGNDRSRLLAERSGFRLEGFSPRFLKIGGRWRDHERWAITLEDWRAQRHR